jgi:hypothetical protein
MVIRALKDSRSKDYIAVFMDDISIYFNTKENHKWYKYAVIETFKKDIIKLNDKKYTFSRYETEYIGYGVNHGGKYLLESKISFIGYWLLVSFLKEGSIFLSLVGIYKKFILNLGELAGPLNILIILSQLKLIITYLAR